MEGEIKIQKDLPDWKANYIRVFNMSRFLISKDVLKREDFTYSIYDLMNLDYKTILKVKRMISIIIKNNRSMLLSNEKKIIEFEKLDDNDFIEYKTKKNEYLVPINVKRGLLKFSLFFNTGKNKLNQVAYTMTDPYNKKNTVTMDCFCHLGVPTFFDNNIYYASKLIAEQTNKNISHQRMVFFTQKKILGMLNLGIESARNVLKSVDKMYHAAYTKTTKINTEEEEYDVIEKFRLIDKYHYVSAKRAKFLTGIDVTDGSNKVYILYLDESGLEYTSKLGNQLVESKMMFINKHDYVRSRLYQILQADRHEYYDQEVVYDIDELKAQIPLDGKNITAVHNVLRDAFFKLQAEGYLQYKRIDKPTNTVLFKFPPKTIVDNDKFIDRKLHKEILGNIETIKQQRAEEKPIIIDVEPTPQPEQPKNNQHESEIIELIHKKISPQVSERTIKELIQIKPIDTIHVYINYVAWRIENQKPMRSVSGWFVHALKNEISFDEDYQKKIDLENQKKEQQKEDKERAEFNKKHIDDIDCYGARDYRIIIQKRNELLDIFNRVQLNKLIQIKLETPELIDGYNTKFEYRYEALEAIYKFIFIKELFDDNPNRQEEAIEKLVNLLNGESVKREELYNPNIEALKREEEKKASENKAKEDEQRKKQEHFKETHYDEELKNVSVQKYESYYNNKKSLLDIFTIDEYRTIIDSKKERLIKQNVKLAIHDIIQDVYVQLFEKKNDKYKEALEMQLDRSIEVNLLEYDRSESQEVVYTPPVLVQENTYHNRYEEKTEVETPTIQTLQDKMNAITPPKIETNMEEPIKVNTTNDEISGERLKLAREKAGMSLRELELLLGCDNSNISKWEKGKKTIPKKYIKAIKETFKI